MAEPSSRRVARRGAALLLLLLCAAWPLSAGASPFRNTRNTPFASHCNGPQGAVLRSSGVAPRAASGVFATQHSVANLLRAERSLRRLQAAGLKSPAAEVRFPRMSYALAGNTLQLPDLVRAQAVGDLGDPANQLTFTFSGWSASDQASLEAYLAAAYPKMRLLYGPPAFNQTIAIIQDDTISPIQGGLYDASANEIRMPPLTGNYPEDTFVLCLLVLHAFHDDLALFYDAWEDGMAGAAATVVQTRSGVSPGYDPVDPGPFYCWSVYEAQNQPALANSTFYPASGFAGMLVWRVAMARTAWLKCWVESPTFFSDFNQAYYSSFTSGLQGDVLGLKDLAASALPTVEGLSFYDWFERQYVLDTSVHVGLKLFTWNVPLEESVALLLEHYNTTTEGSETPRGGQAEAIYWNYDFTLSLYAEEGNTIDIASSGEGVGEGFLIPTFFNVGGAQRITVQLDLAGLRGQYPYPYGVRAFDPGQNDFYGAVLGGPNATLDVAGAYSTADLSATRGVWGKNLSGSRLSPGQITVTLTNPQDQVVTRVMNVGWDGYLAFLPGGGQAGLQHTFVKPANGVLMIALPLEPQGADAPALFGLDPTRFLLARWDPSQPNGGGYDLWPALEPLTPGRGYWLKLYSDATLNLQGLLPPENQPFLVSLPLGWSQVGSPRRTSVTVSSLQVQVGTGDPLSFTQALNSGYLQQGFYRYVPGGSYELADTLEPFEGYWIRCLLPGGARLVFPAL